jgi:hypothetical protein
LDTISKGIHPGTIPARFGLIWFSGFRGEDLNVIFYQNIPNLHNRYNSAERKISQKRRFKCESLRRMTDGRRTPSDGKSSHGFWPGELKMIFRKEKGFSFYFLSKLKQNTNQICVSL